MTSNADAARPLQGRVVIELSNWVTGPLVGHMLVALGASVIKVEAPDGDPFRKWPGGRPSPRFAAYNRGKRSAAIDLKTEGGRATLRRVAAAADVVLMALRPDCAAELGADHASLAAVNPAAIFCEITGLGPTPPPGAAPGFETVVQATGGLLSTLIDPAAPAAIGPPILEHLTAQYAVQGILSAMLDPGAPRHVRISMLHASLALMGESLTVYANSGAVFGARTRPSYSQAYMFACGDGQIIAMHLSAADRNWDALVAVAGNPAELEDADRFGSRDRRVANFVAAQEILAPIFATRPCAAWLRELRAAGVPAAAVNRVDQLADDPAVRALGVIQQTMPEAGHGERFMVVSPPGAAGRMPEGPPPIIGEHTREVLREFGHSTDEIDALTEQGAVALGPPR